MKKIMSGNEAMARGAFEAGVKVAAAYPGTPSTEILETIAQEYKDIYADRGDEYLSFKLKRTINHF